MHNSRNRKSMVTGNCTPDRHGWKRKAVTNGGNWDGTSDDPYYFADLKFGTCMDDVLLCCNYNCKIGAVIELFQAFTKIWQAFTSFGKIWQALTSIEKLRQAARRFDKLWQALTRFEKLWKSLISFNTLRQDLISFDEVRQALTSFNKLRQASTSLYKLLKTSTNFCKNQKCLRKIEWHSSLCQLWWCSREQERGGGEKHI